MTLSNPTWSSVSFITAYRIGNDTMKQTGIQSIDYGTLIESTVIYTLSHSGTTSYFNKFSNLSMTVKR